MEDAVMENTLSLARLLACICGRSLPIRGPTVLRQDHPNALGIAFIRRAGDARLQAVAFGRLDQPPALVSVVDPLARHDPGLERLADCLDLHLCESQGCQVWIPD